MEKFNVYEFKGVYWHDGRKALVMKMSLEECINKYFSCPGMAGGFQGSVT